MPRRRGRRDADGTTRIPAVTNMQGMFQGAAALDIDISGWNVSTVTDMNNMFQGAGQTSLSGT